MEEMGKEEDVDIDPVVDVVKTVVLDGLFPNGMEADDRDANDP